VCGGDLLRFGRAELEGAVRPERAHAPVEEWEDTELPAHGVSRACSQGARR
jgi:hypothetical protein